MATMTMQLNDRRPRGKVPLRHSLLFNKSKHSEDWHQAIKSVAGVLHPLDTKFPYHLLRQATDVYLKKKGKITQADVDIRLAILIDGHEAKDIAVAAAAHAITATSLRVILHVDLNIAHGNYWGLETWLQCLIAANCGNPASVTDLEATWARQLLPFATHGPGAAGKLLIDLRLVRILSSIEGNDAAVLTDLLALEGPDFISGTRPTLREGLIERYGCDRGYIKLGALLVEVPGRTKDGLREILESAISILGSMWTSSPLPDRLQLLGLFTKLVIARPMTQEALNLVQAALFMSAGSKTGLGSDFTDAILCLNGIATTNEQLGPGLAVSELLTILQGIVESPEDSIVKLVRLLASCFKDDNFEAQLLCWRDLAYYQLTRETRKGVFDEGDLLKHTLITMKAAEWLSFLEDVQSVFATGPPLPSHEEDVPAILRFTLQKYRAEVAQYTNTLTRLETALGCQSEPIKCILIRDGVQSSTIGSILKTLKAVENKSVELLLQQVVGLLSAKTKNGGKILVCIASLSEASEDTARACKRIWDAKHGYLLAPRHPSEPIESAERHNIPAAVVEVMVAGWMQNVTVSGESKDAISLLASLLGVKVFHFDIPQATLASAAAFWQKIEDDIVQEEARLVALRKALKAKDPKGTALLLQEIGVPDTTELDEEMIKLPAGVRDLAERLSDNEVELTFSIAAFTQLQRAAMGIPEGANTLMLQLSLDYNNESSLSFCLHYNTDKHFETLAHTRYVCSAGSENPTKQICTSAQTALTWQLSRVIYSEIRRAQLCVSCSARNAQPLQLRRSTPCTSNPYACAQLWYNLPLHVRVPEIRTDTFSVDMALASVYAAAMANKPELLPNCPIRGNEHIKSILNSLPTMSVMRDAVNLSSVLASYHADAEKLISWAVVHHRGFLATATGLLKIPNLPPGTHQFVLANVSPKLENAFVQRVGNSKKDTTVLFHGTSLDRLAAILAQGLRVCSGTTLQRTGAAHGKGIYLSDDPSTSFYYSPASLSWKNSGLSNMRMILGCEMVGTASKVTGNIHVVTDPESVMVRGHIEPAMASGMKALRSGAA
ncbi:hypothetical protein E8E11_010341 [Didymella keratinophila]|nr:hypothetical protein E8E11_010341 [Didymella keratinophila]